MSPLPVATALRKSTGHGQVRRVGSAHEDRSDERPPDGPPPPTREELETAQTALHRAEGALAAARQEIEALRSELEAERENARVLAEAFDRALENAQLEMRSSYAELVLEGCRHLLGGLGDHDEVFRSRLDTVSEQLVLESDVVLRVAPVHKRSAEAAVFGRMGWSVEVDPKMDGGCVALCRNATVDARLSTALEGLEASLRSWLSQDGPGTSK